MKLETHGRWPLVGAGALVPTTALALEHPTLRPLAALLWHQTEEWVWPGSFLPWINRQVLESGQDEFPIDRRVAVGLNVVFGWGVSLATMLGARAAAPEAMLYVSHLGNAGLHLSWAIRHRRYDPGTATSIATLIPVGVVGLRGLITDPAVSGRSVRVGVAGGVAMAVAMVPVLKWRIRRAGGRPSSPTPATAR